MTRARRAAFAALLAALLVPALPALAIYGPVRHGGGPLEELPNCVHPVRFVCDGGFTMRQLAGGYRIEGSIRTPTPGFSYDVGRLETQPGGGIVAPLNLYEPNEAVAQVTGSVSVSYDLVRDKELPSFTFRLNKSFRWGPDEISCEAWGQMP